MACLRAIEVSSEESTKISGTPRRTASAAAFSASKRAASSAAAFLPFLPFLGMLYGVVRAVACDALYGVAGVPVSRAAAAVARGCLGGCPGVRWVLSGCAAVSLRARGAQRRLSR